MPATPCRVAKAKRKELRRHEGKELRREVSPASMVGDASFALSSAAPPTTSPWPRILRKPTAPGTPSPSPARTPPYPHRPPRRPIGREQAATSR
ncbi:hypothetical protein ZWY2020_056436 [Hordeum vulgare]|nr:hypothetical protein ZWY2020_056436 [Hordeum vulgare]